MKLIIMHEINLNQHHVFVRFVAVLWKKIHWAVEMHVSENFFQFNSWQDTVSMYSKLKYVKK